jgi:uncharacterized damage-inducible protein DinB
MNADQAKGFLNFFLGNIANEAPITRRVIAAIPQEKCEYKPDAKSMTARELAWHIAGADMFFLDAVVNGKFDMSGEPPNAPATIAEILAWHEKALSEGVDRLKALPPEKLLQPVPFFNIIELPAVMFLNLMLMHMSHHRGQLSAYLRPMGGKVPAIYGGSADEPFEMPAKA